MDINEIRQKRLEYFNGGKSISLSNGDDVFNNENNKANLKKIEIDQNNTNSYSAYINYNNHLTTTTTTTTTPTPTTTTDNNIKETTTKINYNSIYDTYVNKPLFSEDDQESAARLAYNKKINEYKQIIEDSYLNHVVNKPQTTQHQIETSPSFISNSTTTDQFLNSSYKNNYERKLSLDTLILTNRSLSSSLSMNDFENLKQQPAESDRRNSSTSIGSQQQLGLVDTATNSFIVQPCTIQYMSAYNIYQPVTEELHPLIQQQEIYQKSQQQQPPPPIYDSESSSLSSPNMNNNNDLKPKQSPRARLRLYQNNNNEELNRAVVNKYNGYSSSTSRSSSSPNSSKPQPSPPQKQQQQIQPHPPTIPPSSSRISKTPLSVHEVRPPSAQKVNDAPNYRKKLIKKANKPASKATPLVATTTTTNNTRLNEFAHDSILYTSDSSRTNETSNATPKEYDNYYKSHQQGPHKNSSAIPDLIQNCYEDSNNNRINELFEKFDRKQPTAAPKKSTSDDISDSEDTLNMSSRESLDHVDVRDIENNNNNNTNAKLRGMNLAINLDELSGDDEKDEMKEKNAATSKFNMNITNASDDDEEEDDLIMQNVEQFRQTKPSFIPNLMLDANDDDKSVSVAASLAKSLCNGIDYKTEMEKLQQNFTTDNNNTNNSKKTVNNGNNLIKQIPQADDASFYLHVKPPSQAIKKNVKPVLKSSQQLNKQSNDDRKTSTPVSRATPDLFNSESFIKNVENYKNNLPQPKNDLKQSAVFSKKEGTAKKNVLWESSDINSKSNTKLNLFAANRNSRSVLPRPKSALQASVKELKLDDLEEPVSKNRESKIFDYKKLNEIESNIDNATVEQPKRPKSAFESRQMLNSVDSPSTVQVPLLETIKITPPLQIEQIVPPQNEIQPARVNCDWSNLPQEIWLNILKSLKHKDLIQFGRACKLFHQIYSDNILWRVIKLKNRHDVSDAWLNWIAERQPNELSIVQSSGNVSLYTIAEMFRTIGGSLHTLNLSSCFTGTLSGDNVVLQASIRCPNIRSLDLSWTLLSNESLKLVVDSFKTIESINLSGCSMIKEDGINTLLTKHGHSLKSLELAGCFHLSPNCILNIGVYCRNLQRLNISNCHRVMNQTIMEACPSWIQLRFLDLRGIKNIKNNCISQLVRKCLMLEGLALANCIHLTDTTVLEIATYKPNFKYIDLKGCKKVTDSAMESISNLLCELEFLDLSATSITDNGLKLLSSSKSTKTLNDLNLSFLPINEIALTRLIKASPRLRKLHLYGCYNLKKMSDIKAFAASENRKQLTICC